jgi:hypothetical protein
MFGYVYCKFHELPDRGAWNGAPGNGTVPAVYAERIRLAKTAGMKVMELVEKDIKPSDIL